MDYITTSEASKKWGISSRRIAILCQQNRIEGTIKKGKMWLIPCTSIKPKDARKKGYKNKREVGKLNVK